MLLSSKHFKSSQNKEIGEWMLPGQALTNPSDNSVQRAFPYESPKQPSTI